MNVFSVFIILVVAVSFSFMVMQFWFYIENYNYILKFNNAYKNLEYSSTPSFYFVDNNYYDPNDSEPNKNNKWRCYNYNNKIYAVSDYGFFSDVTTTYKNWNYMKDCIIEIFETRIPINYNPCEYSPTSSDCQLLKTIMNLSS